MENATQSETYFRLVPHDRIAGYEQIGWIIIQRDLAHHSVYGVLMKWSKAGQPEEPSE